MVYNNKRKVLFPCRLSSDNSSAANYMIKEKQESHPAPPSRYLLILFEGNSPRAYLVFPGTFEIIKFKRECVVTSTCDGKNGGHQNIVLLYRSL